MSNISRRKPADNSRRKKPTFSYGGVKKTYDSYVKEELEVPNRGQNSVGSLHKKCETFLSDVDVRYKPIRRIVRTISRRRVLNPNTNKLEEFLTYTEDWEGVNFFGKRVKPVISHEEGRWARQLTEPYIGDQSHEIEGYNRIGEEIVYDIKFTKENVDKIINSSAVKEHELIKFIIHGPNDRTDYVSYDYFVSTPWQTAVDVMMAGGFEGQYVKEILQRATK